MGAYGSPELPPLRAHVEPEPARIAHRRLTPIRVMLWSIAIVLATFALVVVAAAVSVIVHPPPALH